MKHLQLYGLEKDTLDIYNEEDIYLMLEEDKIDSFEEGFMRGYLAS